MARFPPGFHVDVVAHLGPLFVCCYIGLAIYNIFSYWHDSQSESRIEHALGDTDPVTSSAVFCTAFNLFARSVSMVDFSTWVAPMDLR